MRAITYSRYGDADVLELTELPTPKVGPDSVLVRVRAASVNPVDWKVRAGYLDPLMDVTFPAVPGWDVAGVVERVGLDTPELQVGDEVYGYVRRDWVQGGTFAELVAAPVRTLARKPATLSFEEAAAVPLAGLTAYQAIRRSGVRSGQTVLVQAAAGGVGAFAVQIARSLGARVIGTASEGNHELPARPGRRAGGLRRRARRPGARARAAGRRRAARLRRGRPRGDRRGVLADGGVVASVVDAAARDRARRPLRLGAPGPRRPGRPDGAHRGGRR